MPRLSVALLNWNGRQHLEECLPSLCRQTRRAAEIVLVDNGSSDGSLEYVRTTYPEIIVVANDTNLGFCSAGNQAIARASGEFVLLLNTDVLLEPTCLEALEAACADADPDVAVLFPKVLEYNDRTRIDTFGARWDRWRLWMDIGRGEDRDRYTVPARTFGAYFVAPCFRKGTFEELGGFDEAFFAMAEDFDVCYRVNVAGYRLMLCPDAVLYHKRHGSKRDNRVDDLQFISRYGVRNLLLVILKNYEAKNLVIYFPWVLASKWAKSIVGSVMRNGVHTAFAAITVHCQVLADVVRLAPHIRERRRQIQARRVLADAEIWQL